MVTYIITTAAVIVFPYVRKRMFDASPAKYSIGGVPLMTLSGIISILFMMFLTYYYITVPGLYGFSSITLETIVALFIGACVIFLVARSFYKSKGLDLDQAFREIPPE